MRATARKMYKMLKFGWKNQKKFFLKKKEKRKFTHFFVIKNIKIVKYKHVPVRAFLCRNGCEKFNMYKFFNVLKASKIC